jgi:hypothetical protein
LIRAAASTQMFGATYLLDVMDWMDSDEHCLFAF